MRFSGVAPSGKLMRKLDLSVRPAQLQPGQMKCDSLTNLPSPSNTSIVYVLLHKPGAQQLWLFVVPHSLAFIVYMVSPAGSVTTNVRVQHDVQQYLISLALTRRLPFLSFALSSCWLQ